MSPTSSFVFCYPFLLYRTRNDNRRRHLCRCFDIRLVAVRIEAVRTPLRVWRDTCHTPGMAFRSESELIAASKGGDSIAVAELFEGHYPLSLRVARGIPREHEGARDAVQSACLSAFRNLQLFRGDATFKTWITRIVNECLMRHARRRAGTNRSVWTNLPAAERHCLRVPGRLLRHMHSAGNSRPRSWTEMPSFPLACPRCSIFMRFPVFPSGRWHRPSV